MRTDDEALWGYQDNVLIAIQDGRPVPLDYLYALPPWRARLMASVAVRAGCLDPRVADDILHQAIAVGGEGSLIRKDITT